MKTLQTESARFSDASSAARLSGPRIWLVRPCRPRILPDGLNVFPCFHCYSYVARESDRRGVDFSALIAHGTSTRKLAQSPSGFLAISASAALCSRFAASSAERNPAIPPGARSPGSPYKDAIILAAEVSLTSRGEATTALAPADRNAWA